MLKIPLFILTLVSFLISSVIGPLPRAMADDFRLPVPGVMVRLSPPLDPPILKGIKIHPENPFRFDFILDQGDSPSFFKEGVRGSLKQEATKLIKYFLASLTIPEKDLWVNLSPYEKDRIIPQSFGLTEMGRDLLAEDYMLKQITASLIYPEDEIGKKFWKRIYEEAAKKFGTTNIPVNTFNKVWIVPEKAVVYENAKAGTAYVVEAKLKVMLEQDYLALSKNNSNNSLTLVGKTELNSLPLVGRVREGGDVNALGSKVVREIIIPELTKEVNEDKNFAQLRQVYNSLILATWYKKKIKESILFQVYANKNKTDGVQYTSTVIPAKAGIHFKNDIEGLYQEYLKAFKKGVYNYIKEEIDPVTQETIPRKYFSGGIGATDLRTSLKIVTNIDPAQIVFSGAYRITADFAQVSKNSRRFMSAVAISLLLHLFGGAALLYSSSAQQLRDKRLNDPQAIQVTIVQPLEQLRSPQKPVDTVSENSPTGPVAPNQQSNEIPRAESAVTVASVVANSQLPGNGPNPVSNFKMTQIPGFENAFKMVFNGSLDQRNTVDRLVAFNEYRGTKGKVLTDRELARLTTPKTYLDNNDFGERKPLFTGNNFTTKQVVEFVNSAKEHNITLNDEERTMIKYFEKMGLISQQNGKYQEEINASIISYHNGLMKTDERAVRLHELGHAMYEKDPVYHAAVADFWRNLDPELKEAIKLILHNIGYDPSVYEKEFPEYIADPVHVFVQHLGSIIEAARVFSPGDVKTSEEQKRAYEIYKRIFEHRDKPNEGDYIKKSIADRLTRVTKQEIAAKNEAFLRAGNREDKMDPLPDGFYQSAISLDQGPVFITTVISRETKVFAGSKNKILASLNPTQKSNAGPAIDEFIRNNGYDPRDRFEAEDKGKNKWEITFVRKYNEVSLQDAVQKMVGQIPADQKADLSAYLSAVQQALGMRAWGNREEGKVNGTVNIAGEKFLLKINLYYASSSYSTGEETINKGEWTTNVKLFKPGQEKSFRSISAGNRGVDIKGIFDKTVQDLEAELFLEGMDQNPRGTAEDSFTMDQVLVQWERALSRSAPGEQINLIRQIRFNEGLFDLHLIQNPGYGGGFETRLGIEKPEKDGVNGQIIDGLGVKVESSSSRIEGLNRAIEKLKSEIEDRAMLNKIEKRGDKVQVTRRWFLKSAGAAAVLRPLGVLTSVAAVLRPFNKAIALTFEAQKFIAEQNEDLQLKGALNASSEQALNNRLANFLHGHSDKLGRLHYLNEFIRTHIQGLNSNTMPYLALTTALKNYFSSGLSKQNLEYTSNLQADAVEFIQIFLLEGAEYDPKKRAVVDLIFPSRIPIKDKYFFYNCDAISALTVIIAKEMGIEGIYYAVVKRDHKGQNYPNPQGIGHANNILIKADGTAVVFDQTIKIEPTNKSVLLEAYGDKKNIDKENESPYVTGLSSVQPWTKFMTLSNLLEEEIIWKLFKQIGVNGQVTTEMYRNPADLEKGRRVLYEISQYKRVIQRNPEIEKNLKEISQIFQLASYNQVIAEYNQVINKYNEDNSKAVGFFNKDEWREAAQAFEKIADDVKAQQLRFNKISGFPQNLLKQLGDIYSIALRNKDVALSNMEKDKAQLTGIRAILIPFVTGLFITGALPNASFAGSPGFFEKLFSNNPTAKNPPTRPHPTKKFRAHVNPNSSTVLRPPALIPHPTEGQIIDYYDLPKAQDWVIVTKSEFLEIGSIGTTILDELIKKGVGEIISSTEEVRLKLIDLNENVIWKYVKVAFGKKGSLDIKGAVKKILAILKQAPKSNDFETLEKQRVITSLPPDLKEDPSSPLIVKISPLVAHPATYQEIWQMPRDIKTMLIAKNKIIPKKLADKTKVIMTFNSMERTENEQIGLIKSGNEWASPGPSAHMVLPKNGIGIAAVDITISSEGPAGKMMVNEVLNYLKEEYNNGKIILLLQEPHKKSDGSVTIIWHISKLIKVPKQKQNIADRVLISTQKSNTGGINLAASDKVLSVQNNGQGIRFDIDPAQLAQLQNAPGFTPVIINVQPLRDLPAFLGINENSSLPN